MKHVDSRAVRRRWPSGAGGVIVTLCLALVLSFLTFALLRGQSNVPSGIRSAVYGVVALLLLFNVYAIYQQIQNYRVRLALSEQLELSRLIGENAADMIAIVDATGRRLYNSPSYQKVLGYSPEELESTEAFEQIHPDDRELVKQAAKEARQTGQGRTLEYRFRHKNGGWRILESTASVIRGRKDELEKLVIVNRDITERREVEKALHESELRQVQRMASVGRLSSGIAHDFNNLLGVIIGYTDILEMDLAEGDRLRENAEEIRKAGQRAAALTRQLLAFSGRQVLEPKVLDLNLVLAGFEKLLRRLIGEDIELTTLLVPSLGRILADQGQIEQVIVNLAANARDAMPHGGKLIIETANAELDDSSLCGMVPPCPGRYVVLSVRDTGVGMDAQTKAKIFEPFFTTKESDKGTGLGLANVCEIVKQSQGHIAVDTELGKGTAFKIYFPRAEGAIQQASRPTRESWSPPMGETILLVEDNESLRAVTRNLLVQIGYQVLEAASARQALDLAHTHRRPIQLLLADVVMPVMSGPALAEKLSPSHPEMKVLYMSGYFDATIARYGISDPGVLLLKKPYTRDTLISKVHAVLHGSLGA